MQIAILGIIIILSAVVGVFIDKIIDILFKDIKKGTRHISAILIGITLFLVLVIAWLTQLTNPPSDSSEVIKEIQGMQTAIAANSNDSSSINNDPVIDYEATLAALNATLEAIQAPQLDQSTPFPITPQPVQTINLPSNPVQGDIFVRPADQMQMVYINASRFLMGSSDRDNEAQENEKPQYQAQAPNVWFDLTEVTNEQFSIFLNDNASEVYQPASAQTDADAERFVTDATAGNIMWIDMKSDEALIEQVSGDYSAKSGYENHPVVAVTWYGASAYCSWAGGRLPTETEWEYAARGPENLVYPWGNQFDANKLNYCDANCPRDYSSTISDGYSQTAPVGSFPRGASWIGLLDMAGNVSEWTLYGLEDYPLPVADYTGLNKVLRGGSWANTYVHTRTTHRNYPFPTEAVGFIGFRCVIAP